jgi:hypothetical protein
MNLLSWIFWAVFGGGCSYAAVITIIKNSKSREFAPSTYGSICILIAVVWSAFESMYVRFNLFFIVIAAILINSLVITLVYPIFRLARIPPKISPILSVGIFIWIFYWLANAV